MPKQGSSVKKNLGYPSLVLGQVSDADVWMYLLSVLLSSNIGSLGSRNKGLITGQLCLACQVSIICTNTCVMQTYYFLFFM